jgi:phage shock protein C
MNEQPREPGLINKLYRNPRRGMIFGVCAGIAEYFGFDVTVTRVIVVLGLFFAFPVIFGAYLVLALLLPVRAPSDSTRDYGSPVERQVRSSPHETLASVRYRFRDLDARLQRLEKYVTSTRYKLDREFRKLEE